MASRDPGSAGRRWVPRDPAYVPLAADPDYWHLALLFRDLARQDDVGLPVSLTSVYEEIRRVCEWFDLPGGSRAFQKRGNGTVELTFAQMYRDETGKPVPWPAVGEAVVREFWTRRWDSDALWDFTDLEVFAEIVRVVCEHWRTSRSRARLDEMAAVRPQPMTWNRDGHRRRKHD